MGQRKYTRLHDAARAGKLLVVQKLLSEDRNPNHFDESGCTPLHYAAEGGHLLIVRELLASGANDNALDAGVSGDTVLGRVAGECSLETARLLVEAGADPTIPGGMGSTASDRAAKRKRGDGPAVYALLSAVSNWPPRR